MIHFQVSCILIKGCKLPVKIWLGYVNIKQKSRKHLKVKDKIEKTNQYKPMITVVVTDLLEKGCDIHLQKDAVSTCH